MSTRNWSIFTADSARRSQSVSWPCGPPRNCSVDTARDEANNPGPLSSLAPWRSSGTTVITEHCRFQLEASKLGRDVVFQVTVFEKEERRRRKLFAATQCSDPFHFLIQFIIREAPDFDTLLQRFVRQLEYRGFEPQRLRIRDGGKWEKWKPVPRAPIDSAEAAAVAAAKSVEKTAKKPRAKSK